MNTKTNLIVKVALLSAIAIVLSFIEAQIPIFPFFLKIDIADIPALIGSIVFGPIAGITIVFIKNILHGIIASSSAGVGEVANFLIGSALVIPLGITMKKNKTLRNYVIGAVTGIVFMIISASILNVYVLLPMYEAVMNFPIEKVIETCNAINPKVTSLNGYILYVIVPFNLLKGTVVMTLGYFLFKALRKPLMTA